MTNGLIHNSILRWKEPPARAIMALAGDRPKAPQMAPAVDQSENSFLMPITVEAFNRKFMMHITIVHILVSFFPKVDRRIALP